MKEGADRLFVSVESRFGFDPRYFHTVLAKMSPSPPDLVGPDPGSSTSRLTACFWAVASRFEMASSYRIIRLPEVIALTRKSGSSIYRDMANGTFPKSVKIGKRAVGWRLIDIENWLADRR